MYVLHKIHWQLSGWSIYLANLKISNNFLSLISDGTSSQSFGTKKVMLFVPLYTGFTKGVVNSGYQLKLKFDIAWRWSNFDNFSNFVARTCKFQLWIEICPVLTHHSWKVYHCVIPASDFHESFWLRHVQYNFSQNPELIISVFIQIIYMNIKLFCHHNKYYK